MNIHSCDVPQFLTLAGQYPIIDVRSPSEYHHAHIPGAVSVPLFNDEERAKVGTTYKKISRQAAIKDGLEFFGPRMRTIVETTENIAGKNPSKENNAILVHCWRGGMRSGAIAWLLDLYGYKVYILKGGYKAFRTWTLAQFKEKFNCKLIGGYTGSSKTVILSQLQEKGQRIIDLEGLAHHKGSTFGHINMPDQPSQEMFENKLATELYLASKGSLQNTVIWLEDESQRLGHVYIPLDFWNTMSQSPIYFIDVPFEDRLTYLVSEYGNLAIDEMIAAIVRIEKRLGGLETKSAIEYLKNEDTKESFRILLKYYDRWYLKGLHRRENVESLLINIDVKASSPLQQLLAN